MGAVVMVVRGELQEESLEMSLVQRDDLIEQLASATADPALRDSILPRALDGGSHAAHLHGSNRSRDLASAIQELQQELGETSSATAGFFCLTVAPFMPNEPAPEVPDLLRRIDALLAAGGNVLLFSPTRALPHDGSRKPAYEGARAFRRGSFPDDSSV